MLFRSKLMAAAAALSFASAASAATILSEDFNAAGFRGAFLQSDSTDRFGASDLYFAQNFGGWTVANGPGGSFPFPLIAVASGEQRQTDGALWLQEVGSSASYTLTGLTIGTLYKVSFLQSGDNIVGSNWTYDVLIDGGTIYAGSGTTLAAGTNPGTTISTSFTATGNSAVLKFADTSLTDGGNVVIDNLSVAAVPEPATWGLLVTGFALVGFAARRRQIVLSV
jgi:hypothetical protein